MGTKAIHILRCVINLIIQRKSEHAKKAVIILFLRLLLYMYSSHNRQHSLNLSGNAFLIQTLKVTMKNNKNIVTHIQKINH